MTTKRTKFDRRKKPTKPIMAEVFHEPDVVIVACADPIAATVKARTPRLRSAHLVYRLAVAEADAARYDDEAFAQFEAHMEEMIRQAANDNDLTTPQ